MIILTYGIVCLRNAHESGMYVFISWNWQLVKFQICTLSSSAQEQTDKVASTALTEANSFQ